MRSDDTDRIRAGGSLMTFYTADGGVCDVLRHRAQCCVTIYYYVIIIDASHKIYYDHHSVATRTRFTTPTARETTESCWSQQCDGVGIYGFVFYSLDDDDDDRCGVNLVDIRDGRGVVSQL